MQRYKLAVIGFMIFGSIGNAQIITDRPDQTESSSTVNRGSLQIETGVLLGFTEDNLNSTRQLLAPTTLFRYGILNGLEIRIVSQLENLKDKNAISKTSGIGDLEIGTKIQLFKKKDVNTEMAFLSHAVLPTGSKSLSNNTLGSINKLSISHELGNAFGLGYNLGYDYFGKGNGDFTYSVALGISVSSQLGFYLEPYGSIIDFKTHEANFDAGITYLLKDNCQLDFSFGTGINHTMNYLSIGCSINISKSSI